MSTSFISMKFSYIDRSCNYLHRGHHRVLGNNIWGTIQSSWRWWWM